MDGAEASPSIVATGANAASSKTTGSHSRSTSAGSSSSPASCERSAATASSASSSPAKVAAKSLVPSLPEYNYPKPLALAECLEGGVSSDVSGSSPVFLEGDYPSPVVIKNTFLDSPDMPKSLEGFLQEREISSCPPGAIGAPPGLKLAKVHESVPEVEEGTDTSSHTGTLNAAATPFSMALPDIDYPSPLVIKNTFIDSPFSGPTSLDGFLQERDAHSAPGSGLCGPPGLGSDVEQEIQEALATAAAAMAVQSQILSTPLSSAMYENPLFPLDVSAQMGMALPPGPFEQALSPLSHPPPLPQANAKAEEAKPFKVVRIAEALPEPELGSPELPTVGSSGHRLGNCKPCAFMHTKGCTNGVECQFCHLCAPGERKRRQKQRLAMSTQDQQPKLSLWNSLHASGHLSPVPAPR